MLYDPAKGMSKDQDTRTIDHDVSCVSCGYNLRSLDVEGQCPECGDDVAHAMHGDYLRYADRAWIEHTLRGLRWVVQSRKVLLITVLCILLLVIAAFRLIPRDRDTTLEGVLEFILTIAHIMVMLSGVALGIGLWMISKGEPRRETKDVHLQTVIRAMSAVIIPALGLWVFSRALVSNTFGLALPLGEAITHVCFVIVWLHMLIVIGHARSMETRCVAVASKRVDVLKRYRHLVLYLPMILLVGHWVGPVQWLETGGWNVPQEPMPYFVMAIGWVLVTGLFATTLRTVKQELNAESIASYKRGKESRGP